MTHKYTKDDNKKKHDHQADRQLKNQAEHENKMAGKHSYSKEADHL
ncbi:MULTISPECIES: DUF3941 domain-containing protein [Fictibacillus]|uniref:DUF3941 domain-containing protein n=1 Tax=Fictibacillus terranigra TaxID=3058424 RepID=A0ABT8E769_9BACL|nr:DUF3941 domain-containing protein [Fictibacillus sp. CENA-BCM004]MDN4073735.1 DUF3941 domain-containing protein [Fictibacillus sp. CENA-BCM004]